MLGILPHVLLMFLQEQMAVFSEQTTVKLSNDNSLLSEEVEMLRGQLLDAKHTISTLQADLHKMELKAEFESKRATAANQKTVNMKHQEHKYPCTNCVHASRLH